ncbi:MAG TPA: nuclear transport factor 2 family protein [Chloroflexota bacterium]
MSQAEEVRRLLALYCVYLDDRRYEEWSHLFSDDAVWALGGREYRGPAQIKAYMDNLLRERPLRRTKHLNTNLIIDLEGGEGGTVSSDFAMLAREGEAPWTIASFGRYSDRVVRRADGRGWQFTERRLGAA